MSYTSTQIHNIICINTNKMTSDGKQNLGVEKSNTLENLKEQVNLRTFMFSGHYYIDNFSYLIKALCHFLTHVYKYNMSI